MPEENNEAHPKDNITVQDVFEGSVPLTQFYNETLKGDYISKGIGMAGEGSGSINMGLQNGAIVKAFLYWMVTNIPSLAPLNTGKLNGMLVTGTPLGTIDPSTNKLYTAYRADVTTIAAPGVNTLTEFPFSTTSNTLGASLVIVYSNPFQPLKTVMINDGILGFYNETVSTTFQNFKASAPVATTTSYIVGDGDQDPSDEALFNSQVTGTDVFDSSEGPWWDNYTADVSSLVKPGETSAEAGVRSIGDSMFWVAQVLSITAPTPATRGFDIFEEMAY